MNIHFFSHKRSYPGLTGKITVVALLVLLALLAACSLKSIYNRLDILIPEYVEGLVTLDDALELDIEQRAGLLLDWHRSTQLGPYADFLRAVQADFSPQLDEARVHAHMLDIEAFWITIYARLNDDMAEVLPRLDLEQRVELFSSIDGRNRDYLEDYVDLDAGDRRERYTTRMLDTYENWLGDLSDAQERTIEEAAGRLQSSAQQRLDMRLRWQQNIQQILVSADSAGNKTDRLRDFFAAFDVDAQAMIREVFTSNKQVVANLTVAIVHSATAEQRAYFMTKTDDYIRIFTELAGNR